MIITSFKIVAVTLFKFPRVILPMIQTAINGRCGDSAEIQDEDLIEYLVYMALHDMITAARQAPGIIPIDTARPNDVSTFGRISA